MKIFAGIVAILALASPAIAAEKIVIAHGNAGFGALQMYVAATEGHFEKVGLDPEFLIAGSGAKTIAAVVGGSADMAITASSSAFYSKQEGVDMSIFGQTISAYHTPIVFSTVWAKKNNVTSESSLEEKEAAMKGARIATTGPGGGDEIIRFYAKRAGLEPDRDMSILHFGSDLNSYITAIKTDRIDGFALSSPTSTVSVMNGDAIYAMVPAKGEPPELANYPFIVMMGLKQWISSNEEKAKKATQAIQMALDDMHSEENGEAVKNRVYEKYYSQIDKAVFDAAWGDAVKSTAKDVHVTPQSLMNAYNFVNSVSKLKLDESEVSEIVYTFN